MNAINFLSNLMQSYNDYVEAIEKSCAMLQSAGVYNDDDFKALLQRAMDESTKAPTQFCDAMQRAVEEYINSTQ